MRPHTRLNGCSRYGLLLAAWGAAAGLPGCGRDTGSPATTPPNAAGEVEPAVAPDATPAGQLLSRMIAAYQSADAYSDRGTITLRQKNGDRWVEDTADFSVVFQRGNRLLLNAYRATVRCDGTEFTARIADELTGNLDGQVVVRSAPAEITPGDLYDSGDQVDPVLAEALSGELGVVPMQLDLLLADEPLKALLASAPPLSRLSDDKIGSHPCGRVAVGTPSGDLVFWVDLHSFALRRLEYPTGRLADSAAAPGELPERKLVADFTDGRLNPALAPNAFAGDIPATAKRVQYFVVPPPPLPTKLFGKRVKDFWFSDLSGDRVENRDLSGRILILVWYQNHRACEVYLRQLQRVYEPWSGNDRLAFRVVSVDGPRYSHRDVQSRLDEWRVSVPALRDVAPCGPDVFGIADAPTLVILDADGVVQYYEVGANPKLAEQLPLVIERLERGDQLAVDILAAQRQRQQAYVDQLDLAMSDQSTAVVPLTEPELAERSAPEQLRLRSLWQCRELKAPGNILAVDLGPKGWRYYIMDGWQSVAEIDSAGKLVRHHRPSLPPQSAISRLRTAVDGRGRRWFVGFEAHGRQAFLFDENWELVRSYPDEEQRHEGLADVRIADLAEAGTPELFAGFWGVVGVHGVSMDGNRIRRCRDVSSVISVVVSLPDEVGSRRLLVTSEDGTILPINRYGNPYPKIRVGRWPIHVLAAAEFPSPESAGYCGLSYAADGRPVAVGINAGMDDVWSHPLSPGVFRTQVEPIASAALLPDARGCWVLAAADGTVHIVAEDGQFTDQFGSGLYLTGLAAARIDDQGVLVLAGSDGTVECFQVER